MTKGGTKKTIIALSVLVLSYLVYQEMTVSENDIYVDKLIYLKKNNSLFTGTLRVNNPPHTAIYSFCNGLPCGKWEYRFKGDLVHKGELLDKNILSVEAQKFIGKDTIVIDHWQESELSTIEYSPYLSIEILKPASFFQSDKKQYESYFSQLSNTIASGIIGVKYDYLTLYFRSDFYNERYYYRLEYEMKKGRPVFKSVESK